jgi:hypothetical protein
MHRTRCTPALRQSIRPTSDVLDQLPHQLHLISQRRLLLSLSHTYIRNLHRSQYPGSQVEVGLPLDLGSQASVRAFAAAINARPGSLDLLVNNAGISFLKKAFTDDGVGVLAQVGLAGQRCSQAGAAVHMCCHRSQCSSCSTRQPGGAPVWWPCSSHAAAMQQPCSSHAAAMQQPCSSHAAAMQQPCSSHAAAMQQPCMPHM